jgi:uncharacterized protein YqgC (DUF456 family)
MTTTALWILAVLLVLAGLVGIVLPALPGTFLVFLGLLLAAWIDGFDKVGWGVIALLGGLAVLSTVLDFVVTGLGARRAGASKQAVVGAAAGTIAGLFFGLPGLFLGPFVGAAAGEYLARRDAVQAGRAGLGTWLGIVLGTAVKLGLAIAMVGLFIAAYFL